MRTHVLAVAIVALVSASASALVIDDFNSPVLDPAWVANNLGGGAPTFVTTNRPACNNTVHVA